MRVESEEEVTAWDQYAAAALIAFGAVDIAVAVRESRYTVQAVGSPTSADQVASVAASIADALIMERRRRLARPDPPTQAGMSVKETRHGAS